MSRNNLQLYVHLVFVTKNRGFMILPKLEKCLHTCFWSKAEELELIPSLIYAWVELRAD
jgi:putative transposase